MNPSDRRNTEYSHRRNRRRNGQPSAELPVDHAAPWRDAVIDTATGLRVRLAATLRDAIGVRDVLHDAWRVRDDEPYFYNDFNDPEAVYRRCIQPLMQASDIRDIAVLCVVAEDMADRPGRIVGTGSLVLDHQRRTIEFGRGAVARSAQGAGVLSQIVALAKMLLQHVPDYALI
ncbi:MAG: hypothetical protein AAGC55_30105, partial [Myxococcota bacterium]